MAEQQPIDTYSNEQIQAYLSLVSFPTSKYPNFSAKTASDEEALEYLTTLQKHHLSHVPFENLDLHYSTSRIVSIDKDDMYQKIVTRNRGRGGYCMQVNLFFATVLKSLGFELIATGGRVLIDGGPGKWSHHVNLVYIADTVYVVDVGFANPGSLHPLPLKDGPISNWGATNGQCRLIYQSPAMSFAQGLWVYQHRELPSLDWKTIYSFGLTPFYPNDFQVLNFAVSNQPTSFFTHKVVVTKFILDPEVKDITGCYILFERTVKRRLDDKMEVIMELKNEEERVMALEKYFGIKLTKREQEAIRGTSTDLK